MLQHLLPAQFLLHLHLSHPEAAALLQHLLHLLLLLFRLHLLLMHPGTVLTAARPGSLQDSALTAARQDRSDLNLQLIFKRLSDGQPFFSVVTEISHNLNHKKLVDKKVDTSKTFLSTILSIRATSAFVDDFADGISK